MEEQFLNILRRNIELGLRHKDYDRVAEVKEFATKIATGKGQTEDLTRYRPNEDADLKAQRDNLYNPLTKYVLARPRKYWQKIANAQGIKKNVDAEDKKRLERLKGTFDKFADGMDLLTWLNWQLEALGVTDPNAWIIYERYDRRSEDGKSIEKTTIYPFIVDCEDALNWSIRFSNVEWLVVRQIRTEVYESKTAGVPRLESEDLTDFLLYAPGLTISARAAGRGSAMEKNERKEDFMVGGAPETYYVTTYNTGTKEVPAMRAGAYTDDQTRQRTFVTWFDPAEHVFQDLIRDKMISDVLRIVHAFPKRTEFVGQCDHKDPKLGECLRGFYGGQQIEENRCKSCYGSGKAANFTTEQVVRQMALPKNPKAAELLDLAKLSFTETLPIDFAKWVDDAVKDAEERVMYAVFNAGLEQKAVGTREKTAAETIYEHEDVYDVVHKFSTTLARHYELAHRCGGYYFEIPKLIADITFPKDPKQRKLRELIAELKAMKEAGAGFDEQESLRRHILEKLNENDPARVDAILARMAWLPFSDKSEVEVSQILAVRSPLDSARILRENWLEIFREIEADEKAALPADGGTLTKAATPFHMLTYAEQKARVSAKVDAMRGQIILAGGEGEQEDDLTPLG
jgi:hypothetical protein